MFNIGGGEFLVIALIALIVLGPQRLPDAARQAGKAIGELRRLSSGFQNELKDAFTESETSTPVPTARRDVLGRAEDSEPTLPTAVTAVSRQPPARRVPLKAAPPSQTAPGDPVSSAKAPVSRKAAATKKAAATTTAAAAKKAPATKKTAATTVPKASRPRTKGS